MHPQKIDYKKSGVDIHIGDQFVDWIKKNNKNVRSNKQVLGGIGGFAALFRPNLQGIRRPILVSATDGVGTKVKIAAEFNDLKGIGQDLVAMCVNDLITCGADPLFFLDYYATGKLNLKQAKQFVSSVQQACEKSHCLLIGGETAEMPGVYSKKDFDCAGFAVGLVDEEKILGTQHVKEGHVIIGLESSGFHSNGYSLLRKVFARDMKKWRKTLLEPTHLYVDFVKKTRDFVHAYAHITGSGVENIPRVIPASCAVKLNDWEWPEMFHVVQKRSGMSKKKMLTTLNCGIGFCAFVPEKAATKTIKVASQLGFQAQVIGEVVKKRGTADVLW
ncbi:MAG: phosphoribosylformylglycinamidine cyclo-ligase [Bdellovibrionales bacterium]